MAFIRSDDLSVRDTLIRLVCRTSRRFWPWRLAIRRVGLGTRIERLSLLEQHSAQRAGLLTERTRRKLRRRLASSVISPAPSPKQDGQSNVCSPTKAASSRLTSVWPARTLKLHIHAQSHGGLGPMASSKDCKAPSSMNIGGSPSEGPTSLHKDSLKLHSNASSASTTTNGHISNTEPKDEHPQRSSGELKGGPEVSTPLRHWTILDRCNGERSAISKGLPVGGGPLALSSLWVSCRSESVSVYAV